jgi:hypothetical protein
MRKARPVISILLSGLLAIFLAGGSLAPAAATEPPGTAPTAAITSSDSPGAPSEGSFVYAGEDLSLTASGAGGTEPYTFDWTGPNGFAASGPSISLSPATVSAHGSYRVTVTDAAGASGAAEHFVQVQRPEVRMPVTVDQRFYETGEVVTIVADISYVLPLGLPAPDGGNATFVLRGANGLSHQQAVPVENGRAVFSFTPEAAGDYSVRATYSGNTETTTAWSNSAPFTVHPAGSFAVSPDHATVWPGKQQIFTVQVQPNEQVAVELVPGPLEPVTITADAAGVALYYFRLPSGFQTGQQSVRFTGQSSGLTGSAAVQVEPAPQAGLNFGYTTIDRAWGGQEVGGYVSGCPQYTYAGIRLDGQGLTSTGFSRLIYGAEFDFKLPKDIPLGMHTLTAVCHASGTASNAVTFEVIDTALPDQIRGLMDVWKDSLFYDEVVWLVSSGISTGYPDGTYRPYLPINRDAMAAFLYRQAGSPDFIPPEESPFEDVETDNQFYKEITWLAAEEISTGWEDGTFRPYEPINRDAMAAFLYRQAGSPDFEPEDPARFSDVPPGTQFHKEINWAAANGITTGYSDGTFHPVQAIDREAVAAFLFRFDQNVMQTVPQ